MIDLHTHILPGMDDGSKDAAESAQMLTLLQQQGVTAVAATPHYYAKRESPEDFLRRREEAAARLPETPLPILLGAEVAYFPGMGNCWELTDLQLGDTGLLLVEMPFIPWTDQMIREVCSISTWLGLTPVLAHVNRYRRGDQFPKYCRKLLENNVLFQCNAEVFETFTGRLWAIRQLKQGNLHFLGSDCHNTTNRAPNIHLAAAAMHKKLGINACHDFHAQVAQWVFPTNE